MSDEIIKVLDNLAQKFGIAIDWTSQNIMPYIQDLVSRYITYNNSIAIMQMVISVILIIIGIVCIRKLIKWKKKDKYTYDDELFLWGIIGSGAIILIGITLIIGNTIGIIQNIYMPELTILKYIRNFT